MSRMSGEPVMAREEANCHRCGRPLKIHEPGWMWGAQEQGSEVVFLPYCPDCTTESEQVAGRVNDAFQVMADREAGWGTDE